MRHRETKSVINDNFRKRYVGPQIEENKSPGKTVPDQSLSVRQIMQRHTSGVPLNVKTPQFNTDEEIENYDGRDPRTMDLVEVHQELEEIAERQKARLYKAEEKRQESIRKEEEEKLNKMKLDWEQEFINKQTNKQ